MSKEKPVVKVTNSGSFRVDPVEIFQSDVTREIMKQTHEAVRAVREKQEQAEKPSR